MPTQFPFAYPTARPHMMDSVVIRPLTQEGGREIIVRPLKAGHIFIGAGEKMNERAPLTMIPLHLSNDETRALGQEIARANMAATDSFPHKGMNAREQMQAAQDMLSFSDETLSFGLRSPEDAVRLWRAWSKHPEDAYPDTWESSEFIAVLGYDPMRDPLPAEHHTTTEVE